MDQLPSLKLLLKHLQQVPYLASKNIYRVAFHFLDLDENKLEYFCNSILTAKKNITKCSNCFVLKEKNDKCLFCDSNKRDQSIVCVIETWQELLAIEKTSGYNGVYHVLNGVISPLDGIGPENLTIGSLIFRIENGATEIIFALNQTPEGEATSSYIASKLKGKPVSITCLARGLPVGSSIEMMDRLTVYKALSERRPF